jgi:hypothetical protein
MGERRQEARAEIKARREKRQVFLQKIVKKP